MFLPPGDGESYFKWENDKKRKPLFYVEKADASGATEPWRDVASNAWSIRSLGGGELAVGLGALHIDFHLKKSLLRNSLQRVL